MRDNENRRRPGLEREEEREREREAGYTTADIPTQVYSRLYRRIMQCLYMSKISIYMYMYIYTIMSVCFSTYTVGV